MQKTIEILKDLIRIPSYVDEVHNENGIIKYIENFIKTRTSYRYVIQEVEGDRKNILVYNKSNPKVALFGHMDSVLPKEETDGPFEPRIEGDKIFGLGSVDMKSGLAIMLKLASVLDSDDFALVFSVDEEYDFKGALKLKEIDNFHPELIVNVEPTDNKILNGCRGVTEFSFTVHGKSAHAGRKEFGINAIEKAVELTKKFQDRVSKLDIEDGGKTSVNLAYLHGGMLRSNSDSPSEVSGLGNVVPNYAEVICEIRIANPEITKEFVEVEINNIAKEVGIVVSGVKFKFYLGSMLTSKSDLQLLEESIRTEGFEVEYGDISLAGYYEVQMLQEKWGGKSVVFGAGPINLSHAANEYLSIESLKKTEKILTNLIRNIVVAK